MWEFLQSLVEALSNFIKKKKAEQAKEDEQAGRKLLEQIKKEARHDGA